ncbi:uroporphyrinogen decarboxylase [Lobosporangium transversale]|uniref:Uroporphyrinogen decarboxylase n=1 Tax=Lobosporangium transversale TaxID=64571 RepID=A0A1Y2GFV7_9FUNG|nr:uroporphyrinogen decarboxylase [Lobosporangium transversale]ORZ09679.1 uroporphyrinogen decarboxylase [Lobosporangium transversale]|eukprot:XP_021878949.1 uroporphyrinogen decarboxylase [Lobosporangium transversale]
MRNDLILRAARGEKTERAPVWVMRQAGRYLPEFRKLREEYDFFTICQTPKLATEATLQPINRYDGLLDAAIIFSDILVIPQAMGLKVVMLPGKGPSLPDPLKSPEDMRLRLKGKIDVQQELKYVFEAITMTRHELQGRVPLIGFVGGPWTLMTFMTEGRSNRMLSKVKNWMYKNPNDSHELLRKITDVTVDFLVGQVRAGAQMLQVFESFAGELSPLDFERFLLPYLIEINDRVKAELKDDAVPMAVYAKGAWFALDSLADSGYEIVSLDWTHDPAAAKVIVKGRVTLQGNLEPNVLMGSDEEIVRETEKMVRAFGSSERYIANLGHGIVPGASVEGMELFLKTVHRVGREIGETSRQNHCTEDEEGFIV